MSVPLHSINMANRNSPIRAAGSQMTMRNLFPFPCLYRQSRLSGGTTLPFFEGLLPEASQRTAIAQALGISERNEFRLLEELGGEVAGALEIWPDDQVPPGQAAAIPNAPLCDDDLVALIKRLPVRPMLAGGKAGLRLSLAGAQAKLPVVLIDGKIALPVSGQPTTHILKPEITRFDGTAENEALCMTLAHQIGLDTAKVEYRSIQDTRYIVIERYDRVSTENGETRRLHQEDFCQALGLTSGPEICRRWRPGVSRLL